jgi:phosphoribosylanthranilate isomerase
MSSASRGSGSIEIKICGITNRSDAHEAVECGADALGFNLFPGSKRFVALEAVQEWISELPSNIRKVAVLVNPTWKNAMNTWRSSLFDALQLHGSESPEFCRGLAAQNVAFIKAVPMCDETSIEQSVDFSTANILLDSATSRGFGGTGQTFRWSLARRFVETHPEFRIILAGGLTPQNVAAAIAEVGPAGVDVTSGIEAASGQKNPVLLREFISAVRKS